VANDDVPAVTLALNRAVKQAFDQAGIVVPARATPAAEPVRT
jgi:hypothetical protein